MRTKHPFLMTFVIFFTLILASPCIAGDFSLTSPSFQDGATLPAEYILNGFGCAGGNASPALVWDNAPNGTKSFAVTVYDPDAPTGSGWWHWVVFNIPSTEHELQEGAGCNGGKLPKGAVQSRTDFGTPGYGGACPPEGHGDHRYIFTVHALSVEKIDLPPESSAAMVGYFLNANTLGKTTLTATYGR